MISPSLLFPLFSGRELFMSNASLFVDDAKACEEYEREREQEETEQKNNETEEGTTKSSGDAEQSSKEIDEDDDDDDDLDMDELDKLEAILSKASIQIREPNIEGSMFRWKCLRDVREKATCFVLCTFNRLDFYCYKVFCVSLTLNFHAEMYATLKFPTIKGVYIFKCLSRYGDL